MSKVLDVPLDERLLLLSVSRRDADAARRIFSTAGIGITICKNIGELCEEIERGAATAVLPDETIFADSEGQLARCLSDQPSWSDFPLIVLIARQQTTLGVRRLESVGHMTLLPRPVEAQSLMSTVRAALRDRRRQYVLRDDIAERERQAKALRENDRRKDEFLAMLAHELRNPLAAVSNAVTVLKMSGDEENRAWASDVVERQVRQLVRLIDDLLDVSRITRGKIRLRKEYIDARTILTESIDMARPLIEERKHRLSVSIEEDGLPLHADVTRVQQIVLNLLTNSAKYTARGGDIWLTAKKSGDQVVISVKDNGVGMPRESLPQMFKLFAQGDRTLARSEGGLGIGLTIVQKLAQLHNGTVSAWSDGPGQGSEFVVRLPLVPRPSGQGEEPQPNRGPIARGARILVVDDNEDTARGMVRLLTLLGNDAIAVNEGKSAIETAHKFQPDFVLLDIGLPGMDGYEVVSALREDEALKYTEIIAISGYGQEDDRRRSQAAGFDHHLVKPVDFDSLITLIGRRD